MPDPYRASLQLEDHALPSNERARLGLGTPSTHEYGSGANTICQGNDGRLIKRQKFVIPYTDDMFKVDASTAQKTLVAALGDYERIFQFLLKHTTVFAGVAGGIASMSYALHDDTDIFTGKTGVDGFVAVSDALIVDLLSTACDAAAPASIKVPIGSKVDIICEAAGGKKFGSAANVVTAGSNAAAAVLTCAGHGLETNCHIKLSGFTGNWAAANGSHVVTVIGVDTFSIPVDSRLFGAIAGAPVFDATFLKSGSISVWLATLSME